MSDATALPNPADFTVNEKEREYRVEIRVTGTMTLTLDAGSAEEARQKASDVIYDDRWEPELDEVDDVSVSWVHKAPRMFRVLRDGRRMQVSRLEPGDLPRDPDERGF